MNGVVDNWEFQSSIDYDNRVANMKKRTVYLDNIDGFEFQKLCEDIFSTLNYGRIERTPYVGDKGRDLIIHTNNGKIVVECKHQPRSSIGRPVIQKLHSAVISEGAIKGIVITTGTFSKAAIAHAKNLTPPIELMDRSILYDLAARAGIELVSRSRKGTVYTFPITNNQLLEDNLATYLTTYLISKPKRIRDILQITKRSIYLKPVYSLKYSINVAFYTTVGIIHTESDSRILFIDGSSGNVIKEDIPEYFLNISVDEFVNKNIKELSKEIGDISIIPFMVISENVKRTAMKHIITTHTCEVSYMGKNRRIYTKLCVPRERDIYIADFSQVYIPENDIFLTLNGRNRHIKIADNSTPHFYVYEDDLHQCEICGYKVEKQGILCNDCGAICHSKSLFLSCSFHCEKCGKTICRNCANYFWKYLIIRITLCNDCAREEIKNGRKLKKYKPIK